MVQIQDSSGNLVSSSNAAVTIASTPPGLTSATANAVNGVATFSNLVVNTANSYTLAATSPTLASATSTSITIRRGAGKSGCNHNTAQQRYGGTGSFAGRRGQD